MKKQNIIIGLLLVCLFVRICYGFQSDKTRNIEQEYKLENHGYYHQDIVIEEMDYRIYFKTNHNGNGSAITVINLTKDKLEVEILKKRLVGVLK